MINAILTMSLTGSAVMLTWLVAGRLFQKRLSAIWHDRFLRVSLFFMLVPLGPLWEYIKSSFWIFVSGNTVEIPPVMQTTPVITPSPVIGMLAPTIPTVTPELPAAPAVPHTVSVSPGLFQILTVIWLLGAAAMLVYKLWCYVRFRRLLTGIRTPLSDHQYEVFQTCRRELKIDSRISVDISPDIPSPLATGLLRPTILLPDGELSDAQLRCVFLHELTHIKRRDLWVRFFALCGVVVHWYNPLMHLLNQKLKEHSEQSCDEQVAAAMSREERLTYGDMLLRLVARSSFGPSEWAVTLSTKESIQKRLSRIVKAGHWTRTDKAVALITAAGLMLCGIAAACSAQEPLSVTHDKPPVQQEQFPPASETEDVPVPSEPTREFPEAARYGYAQALTDINWENFRAKITETETRSLDQYLPILTGGEFIWLRRDPADEDLHTQQKTTIQGMLDIQNQANSYPPKIVFVESILFADLFQRGEENMCLLLPHLGYQWLILHEEDGTFYGIDMPVRWFGSVQKDGLYAGSGGAAHTYYHRMTFENGDYTESDLAAVHDNVLYLDGEPQSDTVYQAWKLEHIKPEAPWYYPSGAFFNQGTEPTPADTPEPSAEPPKAEDTPVSSPADPPPVQPATSTVTIGGVTYDTYTDNLGTIRLKNSVGNPDELYITELLSLDTLVDGKYPVNSRGETYGLASLADYAGEFPMLIAVDNVDAMENHLSGYLWWEDYYADFSDPDAAARYAPFSQDFSWLNLPLDTHTAGFYIPLYNAEHKQIGVYALEQQAIETQSWEISALEQQTVPAETESTSFKNEEMSETAHITQGAIIIDGVVYPRPANNHGSHIIYDGSLSPHEQAILDALPNGTYPKNSKGEYYGSDEVSSYLNLEPDLILATGTDGHEGYVWWEDTKLRFERLDDLDKVIWNEEGYLIPLYDSEHIQIGWKQERTPSYKVNGDYVQITSETVDALRTLLS